MLLVLPLQAFGGPFLSPVPVTAQTVDPPDCGPDLDGVMDGSSHRQEMEVQEGRRRLGVASRRSRACSSSAQSADSPVVLRKATRTLIDRDPPTSSNSGCSARRCGHPDGPESARGSRLSPAVVRRPPDVGGRSAPSGSLPIERSPARGRGPKPGTLKWATTPRGSPVRCAPTSRGRPAPGLALPPQDPRLRRAPCSTRAGRVPR